MKEESRIGLKTWIRDCIMWKKAETQQKEKEGKDRQRRIQDVDLIVREPRDDDPVSLFLRWDYNQASDDGSGRRPWTCKQVSCRVKRHPDTQEFVGIEFGAVGWGWKDRRSVLASNKEEISETLVRAVMFSDTVPVENRELPPKVFLNSWKKS